MTFFQKFLSFFIFLFSFSSFFLPFSYPLNKLDDLSYLASDDDQVNNKILCSSDLFSYQDQNGSISCLTNDLCLDKGQLPYTLNGIKYCGNCPKLTHQIQENLCVPKSNIYSELDLLSEFLRELSLIHTDQLSITFNLIPESATDLEKLQISFSLGPPLANMLQKYLSIKQGDKIHIGSEYKEVPHNYLKENLEQKIPQIIVSLILIGLELSFPQPNQPQISSNLQSKDILTLIKNILPHNPFFKKLQSALFGSFPKSSSDSFNPKTHKLFAYLFLNELSQIEQTWIIQKNTTKILPFFKSLIKKEKFDFTLPKTWKSSPVIFKITYLEAPKSSNPPSCKITKYLYKNKKCLSTLECTKKNMMPFSIGEGNQIKRICGHCPIDQPDGSLGTHIIANKKTLSGTTMECIKKVTECIDDQGYFFNEQCINKLTCESIDQDSIDQNKTIYAYTLNDKNYCGPCPIDDQDGTHKLENGKCIPKSSQDTILPSFFREATKLYQTDNDSLSFNISLVPAKDSTKSFISIQIHDSSSAFVSLQKKYFDSKNWYPLNTQKSIALDNGTAMLILPDYTKAKVELYFKEMLLDLLKGVLNNDPDTKTKIDNNLLLQAIFNRFFPALPDTAPSGFDSTSTFNPDSHSLWQYIYLQEIESFLSSDQSNPDQSNSDQSNSDQSNPDQSNSDQSNSDQSNSTRITKPASFSKSALIPYFHNLLSLPHKWIIDISNSSIIFKYFTEKVAECTGNQGFFRDGNCLSLLECQKISQYPYKLGRKNLCGMCPQQTHQLSSGKCLLNSSIQKVYDKILNGFLDEFSRSNKDQIVIHFNTIPEEGQIIKASLKIKFNFGENLVTLFKNYLTEYNPNNPNQMISVNGEKISIPINYVGIQQVIQEKIIEFIKGILDDDPDTINLINNSPLLKKIVDRVLGSLIATSGFNSNSSFDPNSHSLWQYIYLKEIDSLEIQGSTIKKPTSFTKSAMSNFLKQVINKLSFTVDPSFLTAQIQYITERHGIIKKHQKQKKQKKVKEKRISKEEIKSAFLDELSEITINKPNLIEDPIPISNNSEEKEVLIITLSQISILQKYLTKYNPNNPDHTILIKGNQEKLPLDYTNPEKILKNALREELIAILKGTSNRIKSGKFFESIKSSLLGSIPTTNTGQFSSTTKFDPNSHQLVDYIYLKEAPIISINQTEYQKPSTYIKAEMTPFLENILSSESKLEIIVNEFHIEFIYKADAIIRCTNNNLYIINANKTNEQFKCGPCPSTHTIYNNTCISNPDPLVVTEINNSDKMILIPAFKDLELANPTTDLDAITSWNDLKDKAAVSECPEMTLESDADITGQFKLTFTPKDDLSFLSSVDNKGFRGIELNVSLCLPQSKEQMKTIFTNYDNISNAKKEKYEKAFLQRQDKLLELVITHIFYKGSEDIYTQGLANSGDTIEGVSYKILNNTEQLVKAKVQMTVEEIKTELEKRLGPNYPNLDTIAQDFHTANIGHKYFILVIDQNSDFYNKKYQDLRSITKDKQYFQSDLSIHKPIDLSKDQIDQLTLSSLTSGTNLFFLVYHINDYGSALQKAPSLDQAQYRGVFLGLKLPMKEEDIIPMINLGYKLKQAFGLQGIYKDSTLSFNDFYNLRYKLGTKQYSLMALADVIKDIFKMNYDGTNAILYDDAKTLSSTELKDKVIVGLKYLGKPLLAHVYYLYIGHM